MGLDSATQRSSPKSDPGHPPPMTHRNLTNRIRRILSAFGVVALTLLMECAATSARIPTITTSSISPVPGPVFEGGFWARIETSIQTLPGFERSAKPESSPFDILEVRLRFVVIKKPEHGESPRIPEWVSPGHRALLTTC
jgi:hypothetical protein